ncbi:MAG: hypothetical protein AAF743_05070 [Planctomycetota bacterium]
MTDADLVIKGLWAVGPAIGLALLLGGASIWVPRLGPWGVAVASSAGMLFSLDWFGGEGTARWKWVVPAMIAWSVAGAVMTTLADDDPHSDDPPRYPAAKIGVALVFALIAMGLASATLFDGDGPERALVIVLVPLVLALVAGAPRDACRLDAVAVAVALGCAGPCILLAGNDGFFHVFLALPAAAGVFAVVGLIQPRASRSAWVLLPGLALAVAVGWNANFEVPVTTVAALLVIGCLPVLLAVSFPRASAWLPAAFVIVVSVATVGLLLASTDLSAYGIGSPPVSDDPFDFGY